MLFFSLKRCEDKKSDFIQWRKMKVAGVGEVEIVLHNSQIVTQG